MLTRRNAVLGLSFATAACAGVGLGGSGLPPGIKTGNIAPDDNLVLGPDENILVGMVARVHRIEPVPVAQSEPSFLTKMFAPHQVPPLELRDPDEISIPVLQGSPDFFVIEADGYRQFGLPIPRRSPNFIIMRETSQTTRLLPFAVRIPKGPYRIMALKTSLGAWVRLPPLEARVQPGTITYIGSFGPITQIVTYSASAFETQTRELQIQRMGRETVAVESGRSQNSIPFQGLSCDTFTPAGEVPRCRFQDLFFRSNVDQDLPQILQRFPRLANAQIVNAPMVPNSNEVWKRWPEVLRPLSVA
jgi:hypothetical protein